MNKIFDAKTIILGVLTLLVLIAILWSKHQLNVLDELKDKDVVTEELAKKEKAKDKVSDKIKERYIKQTEWDEEVDKEIADEHSQNDDFILADDNPDSGDDSNNSGGHE